MTNKKKINFPNPIYADNSLNNLHCFYVGTSGSGKTTAVKKLAKDPRLLASQNYVFFDPFGDYPPTFKNLKVDVYTEKSAFYRALLIAKNSRKKYRIAYSPNIINHEEIDFFCGACWSVGDARKPFHIIIEEVAQYVTNSGKAQGYLSQIISVGRKFGISCTFLFQRGQEVPKTIISNCSSFWIGAQSTELDCNYLGACLGIEPQKIKELKKLEYLYRYQENELIKGKLRF